MSNSITKLYGGKVLLSFDESRHEYKVDGIVRPGVTTILKVIAKPALVGWAVKCCAQYLLANLKPGDIDEVEIEQLANKMKRHYRDVTAESASIGTIVHAFCERYVRGQKPSLPKNVAANNGCTAFLDWYKDNEVKPVDVEFRVYSVAHGYCGSGDLDAYIADERCVVDYKTSSGIWPEYYLQGEGYMIAREEEDKDIRYDGSRVVRFDKVTGECEVSPLQQRGKYEPGFLGAIALHRALEEANKGKRRWRATPTTHVVPAGLTWAAAKLLEKLGDAAEELYEWRCEQEFSA